MGPKYGYLTINQNIAFIWKRSLQYWRLQKKLTINSDTSFATNKYAVLNLSRKRSFKQSEQYFIKLAKDLQRDDITHVKTYFEYMGDSIMGAATSRMEIMINDWIKDLDESPIKFLRSPIKDNEIYFTEIMEEEEKVKKEEIASFCAYCGFKFDDDKEKFCKQCGTTRDNFS